MDVKKQVQELSSLALRAERLMIEIDSLEQVEPFAAKVSLLMHVTLPDGRCEEVLPKNVLQSVVFHGRDKLLEMHRAELTDILGRLQQPQPAAE